MRAFLCYRFERAECLVFTGRSFWPTAGVGILARTGAGAVVALDIRVVLAALSLLVPNQGSEISNERNERNEKEETQHTGRMTKVRRLYRRPHMTQQPASQPAWGARFGGGGLAKRVSASNDATRKCALFFSSWIIRLNHSFVEFSSQERTRTKKEGKKGRKLHHGLDSTDGVSGTTDGRGVCAIDGRGGHTVVGGREAVGGQGGQVAVGARGHVGVALFMAALVAN